MTPDAAPEEKRREAWDVFYEPDPYREAPDFIHLADEEIQSGENTSQATFWRGSLSAVSSFWTG